MSMPKKNVHLVQSGKETIRSFEIPLDDVVRALGIPLTDGARPIRGKVRDEVLHFDITKRKNTRPPKKVPCEICDTDITVEKWVSRGGDHMNLCLKHSDLAKKEFLSRKDGV